MLTTMLDASLPLTPPEWPEWGNPIESEAEYRTIAAYSPYDNMQAQTYPHILALAGLTDPAGHLLGAGEMDCQAARARNG